MKKQRPPPKRGKPRRGDSLIERVKFITHAFERNYSRLNVFQKMGLARKIISDLAQLRKSLISLRRAPKLSAQEQLKREQLNDRSRDLNLRLMVLKDLLPEDLHNIIDKEHHASLEEE